MGISYNRNAGLASDTDLILLLDTELTCSHLRGNIALLRIMLKLKHVTLLRLALKLICNATQAALKLERDATEDRVEVEK